MFEKRRIRQLIEFFGFAMCGFALMPMSLVLAAEEFERWEKRIQGTLVYWVIYKSTEDLHRHCPDFVGALAERGVRGGFTPECEERLDKEFSDRVPRFMPFHASDNRITWRYVFDQPQLKRSLVLDALAKQECRSIPDNTDINELAEHCRVDAIADFAVLKYQCAGNYHGIRGRIDEGIELPWWYVYPLERLFDNESYWRKRWGIENGYFLYAWIAAKCAGLPDGVLASLGVFEDTMEISGYPEPGNEDWWWAEQGFEAFQLMELADRLVDNLTHTKYGYETDTLSDWQRVQPVMAELLQIKDPGEHSSAEEETVVRLKHFVAAQTWMEKRRTPVNEDWLLEQVGEFSDEELAQAAEEATAMMNKQGVGTTWN